MSGRRHSILVYRGLKSAVGRLLDLFGCQEAAAEVTRIRRQELSDYANRRNPDCEDRHMPIDVVFDLETEIGDPVVTRELARRQGFLLVHAPDVAAGIGGIEALTGKALKETGDAVAKIGAAIDDKVIDAGEADTLPREIDEAIVALCELKALIAASGGKRV